MDATMLEERPPAFDLEQRQHAIDVAIADLQAQGRKVTNAAVLQLVGGRKGFVNAHLQQWRQQQRADRPPVAPAPEVVTPASQAPRPASLPYLQALRQQCIEDRAIAEDLRRETQQHAQDQAERQSALSAGVREVRRLVPLYRQAYQQSLLPLYHTDAGLLREVARLRSQLIELIGEADTQRIAVDPTFRPWWMTGER